MIYKWIRAEARTQVYEVTAFYTCEYLPWSVKIIPIVPPLPPYLSEALH